MSDHDSGNFFEGGERRKERGGRRKEEGERRKERGGRREEENDVFLHFTLHISHFTLVAYSFVSWHWASSNQDI
ncbi:MAG: hypothetical protein JW915_13120 [Chitinispirillaceae bacterium]|nr:hypothetical protein [Chitinispirillaceae bacterium]